jgi:hypothetical protein
MTATLAHDAVPAALVPPLPPVGREWGLGAAKANHSTHFREVKIPYTSTTNSLISSGNLRMSAADTSPYSKAQPQ